MTATEILTVTEAAKMLNVSRMTIHRYISSGKLKALRVKSPGRAGWSYVLSRETLDAAEIRGGGKPGPVSKGGDEHILQDLDTGRFFIAGTHNWQGDEYSYKSQAVARRRSREAYEDGLEYKAGDRIYVKLTTKELRRKHQARTVLATLLDDVTHIDKTVLVSIKGEATLIARRNMGVWAIRLAKLLCGHCNLTTDHYDFGNGPICTICFRTYLPVEKNYDK